MKSFFVHARLQAQLPLQIQRRTGGTIPHGESCKFDGPRFVNIFLFVFEKNGIRGRRAIDKGVRITSGCPFNITRVLTHLSEGAAVVGFVNLAIAVIINTVANLGAFDLFAPTHLVVDGIADLALIQRIDRVLYIAEAANLAET